MLSPERAPAAFKTSWAQVSWTVLSWKSKDGLLGWAETNAFSGGRARPSRQGRRYSSCSELDSILVVAAQSTFPRTDAIHAEAIVLEQKPMDVVALLRSR